MQLFISVYNTCFRHQSAHICLHFGILQQPCHTSGWHSSWQKIGTDLHIIENALIDDLVIAGTSAKSTLSQALSKWLHGFYEKRLTDYKRSATKGGWEACDNNIKDSM